MHNKNIYILIMFAKFQTFFTRIAPCAVAKFNSSLEICHDTHGCHSNFTAWTLDLSWIGIKRCCCRAKPSFSVQNSSSGKSVVSKFSFYLSAFPNYFHFSPPPPIPFYSSPLSTFPFLLVGQQHGCEKHINC